MTATERAKRSDALYYETVSVTRRVLCDMIANREADLEDARAENAKMREEFNKMDVWHSKELTAAMDENAKLRELVRHMHTCMEHYEPDGSVSCDRCPLDNDMGDCDYEQRMRELGIEVE